MQTNLFNIAEPISPIGLSIEDAAQTIQVSTATVRNWIKTGYLSQVGKGLISADSLNKFIAEVAGVDKLNARANKSKKDGHNHHELSEKVTHLLKNRKAEILGEVYENSLSDAHRNKEGIYYTPSEIVNDMLDGVNITPSTTFLDPCCGAGNFIMEALRKGVSPENVYGFDTDTNAVAITQQRILEEYGYTSENIIVGDFLALSHQKASKNVVFDVIMTNPPWGKKIDKSDKERYAQIYATGKSTDTSSLFFFAAFQLLKKDGFIGFLIQEAFFNIATFEDARKKILDTQILRLVDYDKPFKGLLTKAQAFILQKSDNRQPIECHHNGTIFYRTLDSFRSNPKKIVNFWVNDNEASVIEKMYKSPHITLQARAKWALGIVTGNNEKYCIGVEKANHVAIYKGSDITKKGLKQPSTFIPNDFRHYQQVAPMAFYEAKEKLIYKFISSNLAFFHDTEGRFILNSANLLIPSESLGISQRQLADLLNSEVINWLFQKLFNTHKVLRGDLEMLPIHTDYFKQYDTFNELNYLNYLGLTHNDNGTYSVKE